MQVVRGIVVALVGALLVFVFAASLPAPANGASSASGSQLLQHSADVLLGDVVWGKVPYCSCFINSATANVDMATANVAAALKDANLTVHLKEQSPRDGWMYFSATFDPHSATRDQVSAAIVAGGGQVLDGPP